MANNQNPQKCRSANAFKTIFTNYNGAILIAYVVHEGDIEKVFQEFTKYKTNTLRVFPNNKIITLINVTKLASVNSGCRVLMYANSIATRFST